MLNTFSNSKNSFLQIRGEQGLLEVLVSWTDLEIPNSPIAVICHPHPQFSGTMNNKVVTTLHNAFQAIPIPTVRFNYRGVGKSEGSYGNKIGEINDLMSVLTWLNETYCQPYFWLSGFSFGAYISYKVATDSKFSKQAVGLISVAPPVEYQEFKELPEPVCPWIIAQGGEDEIVNAKAVLEWAAQHKQSSQIIYLPTASHFFDRQLVDLKNLLIKSMETVK